MNCKSLSMFCAAAGLTLGAVSALADPPPNVSVKQDPAALGRLDALLTLCAKADAKNRATYQKLRVETIVFGEGTAQEMRVPGSDTAEYRSAYAAMVDAAGKVNAAEFVGECSRIVGADAAPKD